MSWFRHHGCREHKSQLFIFSLFSSYWNLLKFLDKTFKRWNRIETWSSTATTGSGPQTTSMRGQGMGVGGRLHGKHWVIGQLPHKSKREIIAVFKHVESSCLGQKKKKGITCPLRPMSMSQEAIILHFWKSRLEMIRRFLIWMVLMHWKSCQGSCMILSVQFFKKRLESHLLKHPTHLFGSGVLNTNYFLQFLQVLWLHITNEYASPHPSTALMSDASVHVYQCDMDNDTYSHSKRNEFSNEQQHSSFNHSFC